MVHQHFTLVPSHDGDRERPARARTSRGSARPAIGPNGRVAGLAGDVGLQVDPRARVWQLSVGEQQRVEILKMLYHGARILILDEPTAVLAPQETAELFVTLRSMLEAGRSVVFISHKLAEVLTIADRITVMRAGVVTAAGIDARRGHAQRAGPPDGRAAVLELPHALAGGARSRSCCRSRTSAPTATAACPPSRARRFEVRAGEIVGIAAVAGNGQSELAEVITGLRACTGQRRPSTGPRRRRPATERGDRLGRRRTSPRTAHGVGSAPEPVDGRQPHPAGASAIRRWHAVRFLDGGAARVKAEELRGAYAISAPTIDTPARILSGGNLQRLILAREIDAAPTLLVAVQPTRGLDVGAIEGVHQLLLELRERGTAILLISEELEELLALADRVLVMYEGQVAGDVRGARAPTTSTGSACS